MADPSPAAVISHWHHLIEGLQTSPLEFYRSVEVAVKRRQIPDEESTRVDYHEGGVLSAKREYLRVQRGRHIFDVCGAPFGNGFFVSWWHGRSRSSFGTLALVIFLVALLMATVFSVKVLGLFLGISAVVVGIPVFFLILTTLFKEAKEGWDDALVAMPFLGPLYERWFRPDTYYRIDTALMFQTAVHAAVLETVDGMTSAKGIRALSELERKPILRDFYGKR